MLVPFSVIWASLSHFSGKVTSFTENMKERERGREGEMCVCVFVCVKGGNQAYMMKMSRKDVWLTTQMGASAALAGLPTTFILW